MTSKPATPDITFVTLIHTALRVDGDRLETAVSTLGPEHQARQLAGIRAFFDHYHSQLELHHSHEDVLFFPALEARVEPDRMRRGELEAQHEELDTALKTVGDRLSVLAEHSGDWETDRDKTAEAISRLVTSLNAHLDLEDNVVLPLIGSELPTAEFRRLESKARKRTPRSATAFLIPWLVEHANPDQRRALFRSTPPLWLLYKLNRRNYLTLANALAPGTTITTGATRLPNS